jgi:hydrogenase nickel incorporation protein HypA/HybF
MHEYHATERILNHAIEQAARANAARITDAHFVIGDISTYTADSIQGAWEVLARGTTGEGARLHFRNVDAELQCMVCFTKYCPAGGEVLCPACGSVGAKILAGEEFYMESLDVE